MIKILLCVMLSIFYTTLPAKTDSQARETERYEGMSLSNTQIRRIHSKYTDVDYKLYINLPSSYFGSKDKRYPVLYVLDADYSFPLTKQEVEHLTDRHRIEDVLIVGIAYDGKMQYRLNRTRDYTISHVTDGGYGSDFQKLSGGADKFLQFIKKELVPYIEKSFPVNTSRGLVGHSYGGLFATYAFLNEPTLFQNYLIVSASLWYDEEKIFRIAISLPDFNQTKPHKLYFAIGGEENRGHYRMIDEQIRLIDHINDKKHKNVTITADVIDKFDHDTIFPAALSRGLVEIYGTK